jgi:hypothetical protein
MIEDQREVIFVEEDIGQYPQADRTYVPRYAAALSIEDTPLTFEQFPLLCAIGIDDIVSGAADGAGTDKIYTYPLPVASDNGFKTFTIEGGDNQQAEEMEYAHAAEITLKGAAGEAWMMSANLIGRQVALSTFTAALSVSAVEEALFSKTKLYIDAAGGTIGTTLKSNTLLDAEITITTGLIPKFTADGDLFFSFVQQTEPVVTGSITFEHDAVGVAEKASWRAEDVKLVRLICEGSAAATPGTTYTYLSLIIDMALMWEKFDAIDEADGNDIVRGNFKCVYSSTDSLFFQIIVVNELAAVIA